MENIAPPPIKISRPEHADRWPHWVFSGFAEPFTVAVGEHVRSGDPKVLTETRVVRASERNVSGEPLMWTPSEWQSKIEEYAERSERGVPEMMKGVCHPNLTTSFLELDSGFDTVEYAATEFSHGPLRVATFFSNLNRSADPHCVPSSQGLFCKQNCYAQMTLTAAGGVRLKDMLAEQAHQLPPAAGQAEDTVVKVWLSSGQTQSPLHHDDEDVVITVLRGVKRVIVYTPEQRGSLYLKEAPPLHGTHSCAVVPFCLCARELSFLAVAHACHPLAWSPLGSFLCSGRRCGVPDLPRSAKLLPTFGDDLEQLLAPVPARLFAKFYRQTTLHIAKPLGAPDAVHLELAADANLQTLLQLCLDDTKDHDRPRLATVDVRRNGTRTQLSRNATVDDARAMLDSGAAFVFRLEHLSPQSRNASAIGRFADRTSAAMRMSNTVHVYMSTKPQTILPPHNDPYDVVVMQLSGQKKWTVCVPKATEVNVDPSKSFTDAHLSDIRELKQPHDSETDSVFCSAFTNQTLEHMACTEYLLHPGDVLYVPRGLPHHAQGLTESTHMTMSLGPTAPSLAGVLMTLAKSANMSTSAVQAMLLEMSMQPRGSIWLDPMGALRVDSPTAMQRLARRMRSLITRRLRRMRGNEPSRLTAALRHSAPYASASQLLQKLRALCQAPSIAAAMAVDGEAVPSHRSAVSILHDPSPTAAQTPRRSRRGLTHGRCGGRCYCTSSCNEDCHSSCDDNCPKDCDCWW